MVADLDIHRQGAFLAAMAKAYMSNGDVEGAIRSGTQALTLLRQAESILEAGRLENVLAMTYLAAGNSTRARELAADARQSAQERGDERLLAHIIDTQAAIALGTDDPATALLLADEALDIGHRVDHGPSILDASVTRARSLAALGRHAEAATTFEQAEAAAETAPPSRRREILTAWAESLAELGRHDEAFALARRALSTR